jgi:hypothetical protein
MKNFFEYDLNNPQERKERFEQYPELSKFYIALSEELSHDEYEEFCEAEKQSYFSSASSSSPNAASNNFLNTTTSNFPNAASSSPNVSTRKKTHHQLKWI